MYYHKREQTARYIDIAMSATAPLKQEQIYLLENHLIPWASSKARHEKGTVERIRKGYFKTHAKLRFNPAKALLRRPHSIGVENKRIQVRPITVNDKKPTSVQPVTKFFRESESQ